ncbi:MAG TPA: OmpH family outer membrane protein [Gammaproteobacteria bacterium]|nr:OmpH family outer membrane protein [Gammaproteobacteria bacterium]
MNKIALFLITFLGFMGTAMAVEVAAVNMPELLQKAPQTAEIREKLKTEFASDEDALKAKQEELRALQEKFSKDAETMSDEEKKAMQKQFVELRADFTKLYQTYQQKMGKRQQEELSQFQSVILREVQAYARDEGYDIVVSQGVLYASPAVDITDEVLERLIAADTK